MCDGVGGFIAVMAAGCYWLRTPWAGFWLYTAAVGMSCFIKQYCLADVALEKVDSDFPRVCRCVACVDFQKLLMEENSSMHSRAFFTATCAECTTGLARIHWNFQCNLISNQRARVSYYHDKARMLALTPVLGVCGPSKHLLWSKYSLWRLLRCFGLLEEATSKTHRAASCP